MTDYRIYLLNEQRAVWKPPQIVDLFDDSAAIEKANQLLDGHVIEVWERARLIIRLEPKIARDK